MPAAYQLLLIKLLESYGKHVQESVFECDLEPAVYHKMIQRLLKLISQEVDNVRLYHLCAADASRIEQLGVGRPAQVAHNFRIV